MIEGLRHSCRCKVSQGTVLQTSGTLLLTFFFTRVLSHPVRCSGKLAVAGAVVLLCDLVSTTQVL
jgi:hypothetical protein